MLVLLLGLLGLSAAAPLERGVYRFHSELVQGNEQSFSVEASAVVSPLGSSSSSKPLYALYVQDLSLAAGKQRGEQLSSSAELPVLFTRSDDDGLIDRVMLHPDDSLQMRNLKRAMLEALQGPQEASRVTEDVSMGTRSVEYRAQDHEVRGFFRTGDFSSFGSDVGNTRVHGEKVLSFAPSGAFQSSHTTTRVSTLRRGHQLKAVSTSAMEFVSSDVMMIDLYPEAEWVESTLVHEIDPSARADSLKARFPPAAALIATLSGPETNAEEALKARSQLVALLNRDEALVEEVLSFLASRLRDASEGAQLTRLYSTVARLNSPRAQELLASEITRLAQDRTALPAVLKSLVALSQPSSPMALMDALAGLQVPQPLADLVDLAIGNVAKFLPQEQADGILAPYIARLKASEADVDKVQLLHVLGNAGSNSPLDVIRAFLSDASIQVRSAALANLRSHLHDESVQAQVTEMFADEVNYTSKPMVSTLLNSVKEGMRKRHMGAKFHELLSQISQGKERVEALEEVRELLHRRFGGKHAEGRVPHWKEQEEHQFDARSTTEVWNDASSPLYDLVAPLYQRNEDVLRYPNHTAFMAANQFGPRFVNLKLTSGVFSGSAGSGCLAGDFKIFDKLYTDTEVFGDLTVLGDLQLYVLSYNSKFDSRVYAIINGNTIVDFSIVNDCSEDAFLIYDGEIDILTYESEIALDIGTLVIYADVYAGLLFDAGYKICLLTLSPFVELYLTGEVYMITDVGATVTALGLIRGGLEGDVYLNYRLGPDTQLGSRNNTCQACIGVYYGYNTQTADLGLFYQRREGLSWGPKNIIPISNWAEPGIPFPTPLIEVCS